MVPVIPSEVRNLASICRGRNQSEIPRFARNDNPSILKSALPSNFVKKNAGSGRHINRIHPRANGNTQEQGGFTGNLRWQAGSLSSHHDGERAFKVRLVKRKGAVAVGGEDANLSRAQAIQEFIGCEVRQDRKAEDREIGRASCRERVSSVV